MAFSLLLYYLHHFLTIIILRKQIKLWAQLAESTDIRNGTCKAFPEVFLHLYLFRCFDGFSGLFL